ncbi:Ig-like domain-containing protein [Verrucomicrobiaceae bacterium 227]
MTSVDLHTSGPHTSRISSVSRFTLALLATTLFAVPVTLFAVPTALDDSYSVDEDDSLTISSGGVILNATFGGSNSVLGNTWQYLDLIENENGANQSYPLDSATNSWNSIAFNTASSTIAPWKTGTAPFQSGTIDGFPPGTPDTLQGIGSAGNGQNLVTTYLFRQSFNLTAAQAVEADWQLEHLIDDGGIIYLNGVEIYRTPSMPQGSVTTTTLSSNGDESTFSSAQLNLSGRLAEGLNTIAVEVHQTGLTSSDAGFQITLVPSSVSSSAGFTYSDDTFNGTVQPNFATGSIDPTGGFEGAGLFVQVGDRPIFFQATSGGWSRQFSLENPATTTVGFRYRLVFADGYEADEYGEAIFELDGVRYGSDLGNSLKRFYGDGNAGGGDDDTGWQLVTFDIPLSAGDHTLVLGAHSSKSTAADENTRTWFDDIEISIPQSGGGILLNDTGDSPTAILASGPSHGTLNLNDDGSFTYRPDSNYFGTDSFTYLARDPSGDSNIATVTLTVSPVNDRPLAQVDTFTVSEGLTLTQPTPGVLANDSDLENSSLTAILESNVSNGSLQLNSNGSFTYTPNAGFFGTDSFTYRAHDGDAPSDPASVTIVVTPINDPPVAIDDNYTTTENVPVSISVTSGLEQVVFSSDFNATSLPAQISGGTLESVQGYSGRGTTDSSFNGRFLRNNSGGNPASATTLTLTNLPPHESLSLQFLLAIIDSWDGNNDDFIVTVDGVEIFNDTFRNTGTSQTYSYPTGTLIFRDEEIGFTADADTYRDAAYDMSRDPSFRDIPHTASTATIRWFAAGNDWTGGDDESWALENLKVTVSAAPVESLTAAGAIWSYLDDGSDQGTAWRTPTYDDSSWQTGPAELGYGDGDEATEVSFGDSSNDKHLTTYFRHSFSVIDADQFATLVVGLIRDDGAAVYLNGTLIALDNLDSGASFATPANLNPGRTQEGTWSEFSVPANLLLEGRNVLAVEVHQDSDQSSDISMNLYLLGKRVANAGVLANDTDPENDTLTAELLTGPQHGTLAFNTDGTFLYTPEANYEGPDSFTYRAKDAEFDSAPATVSLTMTKGANDFPVTMPDLYLATEDTPLTVPTGSGLLANDSDPDGPSLAAILESQPANGTITLNVNGRFTYTPNLNFFGTDTFTYRATDTINISPPETVTINVTSVNDPPAALPESYLSPPGQTLTVSTANGVLANDFDPDNASITAALQSTTSSGTLNLSSNGSFTYTPNGGFSGPDTFTYRASDGSLSSEVITVTITVNSVPVARDDNYTTTEDAPLITAVAQGLLANDVDINLLTVVLLSGPSNGTLSLSLDGSFIYVPHGDFNGIDTFTYRASDSLQESTPATVTLTVTAVNDAPRTADDSYQTEVDQALVIGSTQGVLANDIDVDSSAITATLTANVTHGTLALNSNGSFTYTPAAGFIGTDSFSYEARDGQDSSGETSVKIEVRSPSHNIVINEIMFQPASGNDLEEFIELTNLGTTPVSLQNWQFDSGVNFTFPTVTIQPGGFLVIAANASAFEAAYGALPNVIGNWTGKLSNSGERIRLIDPSGMEIDEVTYYDQGDWAIRERVTVGGEQGWSWSSQADGGGSSLELINPALSNKQGQNWASSLNNLPTPSAQNSTALDDTAPLILNVEHVPAIPNSTDPIGIVAELRDETGEAVGGTLHYRVSGQNPGPFLTATMLDDGYNCDSEAGDGIYGFMLPPQANGTVVEFYLESSDGTHNRTWPAPTTAGQSANALLQVDNEPNTFDHGFYRIVMSLSELNQWRGITRSSNAMMNATLILDDGSGPKIRYLAGMRVRGAGSRNHTPVPMRLTLPRDNEWNDATTMNLNTKFTYLQFLGMKLFQASDMQAPDTFRTQVRINGGNIARGDGFDYGSMVHVQPLSGEFVDDKFAADKDGNLYKKARPAREFRWRDGDIGGYEADGWSKQTNSSENDWSDLDEMLRVMNNASGDPDYLQQVEAIANLDQWMRWFAAMAILANGETNMSNGADDDYTMYRGANDPRFVFVPHDLDTILSLGDGSRNTNPNHTLFDMIESGDVLDPLIPLFSHPDIIARYYAALRELLQTTFSKPEFDELLDNSIGDWIPPNELEQIRTFMDARRIFIEGEVERLLGPPGATTLATSKGTIEATHGPLYISEVLAINNGTETIDGVNPDLFELHNSGSSPLSLDGMTLSDDPSDPARYIFPSGSTIPAGGYLVIRGGLPLSLPGLYTGFNLNGQGETLSLYNSAANGGALIDAITFGIQIPDFSIGRTGPGTTTWQLCSPSFGEANQGLSLGSPSQLRINEWMSQSGSVFENDFIELYNPSSQPISLGSLFISDEPVNYPAKHQITNLSFIGANGFTRLIPLGSSANPNRADELPFRLAANNEWIALRGDNNVLIDQVHWVNQRADISRGRVTDGGAAYRDFSAPTPGYSNSALLENEVLLLQSLRISEIMYDPSGGSEFEFIELQNIGSQAINLFGVRFTEGIDFTFPHLTLAPGEFVIVVRNLPEFTNLYGNAFNIAGEYDGRLDNGGERLRLEISSINAGIHDFEYDDWYPAADGAGFSLTFNDTSLDLSAWGNKQNWSPSLAINGTPGNGNRLSIQAPDTLATSLGDDFAITPMVSYGPFSPAAVSFNWQFVNGPGQVTFATPMEPATAISFSRSGTYTVRLEATAFGLSDSQTILITVYNSYSDWVVRNFGAEIPGETGKNDDPDLDGVTNLFEFALMMNPNLDDSELFPVPAYDQDDNALTLTFSQNFVDPTKFALLAEVSSDLKTWTSGQAVVNREILSNNSGVQTIRALDLTTASRARTRFMRLRVICRDGVITSGAPRILGITNIPGLPTITFTSQFGQRYQLEATNDPAIGWSKIGTPLTATGEQSILTDPTGPAGRLRLYRVIQLSSN